MGTRRRAEQATGTQRAGAPKGPGWLSCVQAVRCPAGLTCRRLPVRSGGGTRPEQGQHAAAWGPPPGAGIRLWPPLPVRPRTVNEPQAPTQV